MRLVIHSTISCRELWALAVKDSPSIGHPFDKESSLSYTVEPLYSGYRWGRNLVLYRGLALSQGLICTKRVHLGVSEVTFIEGCPHALRGVLMHS